MSTEILDQRIWCSLVTASQDLQHYIEMWLSPQNLVSSSPNLVRKLQESLTIYQKNFDACYTQDGEKKKL